MIFISMGGEQCHAVCQVNRTSGSVGAALLSSDATIIGGCNVENASYGAVGLIKHYYLDPQHRPESSLTLLL